MQTFLEVFARLTQMPIAAGGINQPILISPSLGLDIAFIHGRVRPMDQYGLASDQRYARLDPVNTERPYEDGEGMKESDVKLS